MSKSFSNYEFKSEFALKYIRKGREEGREEGLREGREIGRREGSELARKCMTKSILKILEKRALWPTSPQRLEILATTDMEKLERWFGLVLSVSSVDELLRAPPPPPPF